MNTKFLAQLDQREIMATATTLISVFLLVCAWWQSPLIGGNEEMYLGKAKGFADPDWIANSPWIHEWAGARLLFQSLLIPCWKYLSIADVSWYGRLLSSLLLSIAVTRLFRILKLGVIPSLFVVASFFIAKQGFVADGWIWKGFEAKTFAYLLIFWAIGDLLTARGNLRICLWLTLATWFHVLTGGWAFIYYLIYRCLQRASFIQLATEAGLYCLATAPLLIYLLIGMQSDYSGEPSADWIYVFIRHPHHLDPTSWKLYEPILAFLALAISLVFLRNAKASPIKSLTLFNSVAFTVVLVSCAAPLLDNSESFLKLYPFRASTLNLFFFFCLLATLASNPSRPKFSRLAVYLMMPLIIAVSIQKGLKKNRAAWLEFATMQVWQETLETVGQNVPAEETIFLDHRLKSIDGSFMRLTSRNVFVSDKFVPTRKQEIVDWYQRIQLQKAFPESLDEVQRDYGIRFFLLAKPYDLESMHVVWENSDVALLQTPRQ